MNKKYIILITVILAVLASGYFIGFRHAESTILKLGNTSGNKNSSESKSLITQRNTSSTIEFNPTELNVEFDEDKIDEVNINSLIKSEPIYTIDNFSDNYYGKVQAENEELVFRKGWIAIYDKKNDEELIKLYSNELAFDLHDGKVKANILSIPYGEQSLIQYQDFNFDGINDFAIMDGQFGCYHTPSFRVYLASEGSFLFNEDFTQLAQANCGMFDVDPSKKTISTMTKSGCCWHQYSVYKVENNIPKLISKETIEHYNN